MRIQHLLISTFAGAGFYFLYRYWQQESAYLSPQVKAKLPNQRELGTIPDIAGNYDIDGVSYDDEGVIVGGDDNKHLVNPVKLH